MAPGHVGVGCRASAAERNRARTSAVDRGGCRRSAFGYAKSTRRGPEVLADRARSTGRARPQPRRPGRGRAAVRVRVRPDRRRARSDTRRAAAAHDNAVPPSERSSPRRRRRSRGTASTGTRCRTRIGNATSTKSAVPSSNVTTMHGSSRSLRNACSASSRLTTLPASASASICASNIAAGRSTDDGVPAPTRW